MTWEIRRLHEEILSREVGAVRKDWGGRLRIALVYPNRYEAAMSNLGFLTIYARVNARADAVCERAFLPGEAGGGVLRRGGRRRMPRGEPAGRGLPLITLESSRPLSEFDFVAFSLSYENDLLNLPALLAAGGVSPFRADRASRGGGLRSLRGERPLVLAGGFAASLSPEPAGVLADAVVVGDGERAVGAILDLGPPRPSDEGYLKELATIPGLFVPAGYLPEYDPREGKGLSPPGRFAGLAPRPGFPARVVRETVSLGEFPPVLPVLSEDAELGRMALVETSRGCPKQCGFCAAAHACPDFREVPLAKVKATVDALWPHRTTVGLVGAAVLDWKHFRDFSREILSRGGAISPASVRADLVDEEIAGILSESGHRTVALAPETGSEDLRARIGKRVADGVFFSAGRTLARAGIVSFKLYFLCGLPGTGVEEEVQGAVAFLAAFRREVLHEAKSVGRMGTITAVTSAFVPKPFTPLQWAPMAREEDLRRRQGGVSAGVRSLPNVRVRSDSPRSSLFQGYVGLSDRRVEGVLRQAETGRARLPRGEALSEVLFREKGADEGFPWEVVAGGLPRRVLRARYESITRR
ncbi:MAG TPA: B12-binding domain-containing radical SAM protein [Candidatus Deferrimicrobiaceae bacterium]|nr:B12-binding domain-containing radical SAM protein [Candidatus Deferrimicrobiaceae bacterium]